MELFPAVLIGGPPHSGKSVLTYSLSYALRRRGVAHYVLRAAPDGEGDWFYEGNPNHVRLLRIKGAFDRRWVERICRDIRRRHLPLLIDVGGQPTPEQEAIFAMATHAILVTRDPTFRPDWLRAIRKYGLYLIADLDSRPEGPSEIHEDQPVLRGVIAGLERGRRAEGAVFEALVNRLAALFAYRPEELRRYHRMMAPEVDWYVDLDDLARRIGVRWEGEAPRWAPEDLSRVLEDLPSGASMALYGRGPAWLYAALAALAFPASLFQFDPRWGWMAPPTLLPQPGLPEAGALRFVERPAPAGWRWLGITRAHPYLDREEVDGAAVPAAVPGERWVADGKLPLWLWTALARAWAGLEALAVFDPRFPGAVVVLSRDPAWPVGAVVQPPG
ncbi:MAG: hypothetical protein C4313_11140 [Thermoflexus sp.]|uniref:CRISPR-associated protein Csx3 n=1 Tax=Thermoflexus sp. TaxID=1969742 RepID=UPI0033298DD3